MSRDNQLPVIVIMLAMQDKVIEIPMPYYINMTSTRRRLGLNYRAEDYSTKRAFSRHVDAGHTLSIGAGFINKKCAASLNFAVGLVATFILS